MSSDSKIQVVQAKSASANAGPLTFYLYAVKFFDVMESIDSLDDFSPVPYYLVCHSLELVFKAFLMAKGETRDTLRKKKYGHNLESVLKFAENNGLGKIITITPKQRSELQKANKYYKDKGFEYMELMMLEQAFKGYKGMPDLITLKDLARSLLKDLEQICMNVF